MVILGWVSVSVGLGGCVISTLEDSAVCDRRDFFGTASLAADVRHLVEGVDAVDNVPEDPGELGVHVGQDDPELRCDLKK